MDILHDDRPSGEALRDAALSLLRRHRAALVRRIQRAFLRHLLDHGPDTSHAARARVAVPAAVDPRVTGAAVRGLSADFGLIRSTGRRRSCRHQAHARDLHIWSVLDRAAAECWLVDNPELPAPAPAADAPADLYAI